MSRRQFNDETISLLLLLLFVATILPVLQKENTCFFSHRSSMIDELMVGGKVLEREILKEGSKRASSFRAQSRAEMDGSCQFSDDKFQN